MELVMDTTAARFDLGVKTFVVSQGTWIWAIVNMEHQDNGRE